MSLDLQKLLICKLREATGLRITCAPTFPVLNLFVVILTKIVIEADVVD